MTDNRSLQECHVVIFKDLFEKLFQFRWGVSERYADPLALAVWLHDDGPAEPLRIAHRSICISFRADEFTPARRVECVTRHCRIAPFFQEKCGIAFVFAYLR